MFETHDLLLDIEWKNEMTRGVFVALYNGVHPNNSNACAATVCTGLLKKLAFHKFMAGVSEIIAGCESATVVAPEDGDYWRAMYGKMMGPFLAMRVKVKVEEEEDFDFEPLLEEIREKLDDYVKRELVDGCGIEGFSILEDDTL